MKKKTAAHYAAENGFGLSFGYLVELGADLSKESVDGDDVLRVAAIAGCEEIVRYIMAIKQYSPEVTSNIWSLLGSSIFERDKLPRTEDWPWKSIRYWKQGAATHAVDFDENAPVAILSDRVFTDVKVSVIAPLGIAIYTLRPIRQTWNPFLTIVNLRCRS